ncbi:MAG: nucleotidyltransferase domain-containing protein [Candidatus Pacearchaeota archaeon]|nr:nucleotidyltransferase domain-containing protein [Candidatus Pacearchaeota archaeon]
MLTKTQEQILSFLLENQEENNTIRGISRKLNKSYTLTYNNISDLEKKEFIKKKSVPPAQIITLNMQAQIELFIEIEFKRKSNFLKKYPWARLMLKDIIKNSSNPFFVLIVFGSYAKGLQTEKSDLDLLMVVQTKEEKKIMKNIVQEIYTKVKKSLIIVDLKDFKEMLSNSEKLNVGNEAKKNHILLYGTEQYYNIIKSL